MVLSWSATGLIPSEDTDATPQCFSRGFVHVNLPQQKTTSVTINYKGSGLRWYDSFKLQCEVDSDLFGLWGWIQVFGFRI